MAINFINGYPVLVSNTTGTSVVVSGAINQSGMLYSVIVPAASGAPSAQQIYDGQNEDDSALAVNLICSGEASASGVQVALSGYSLTSETAYTMYVTASGYDDGLYASGEPVAFTTPDITAPSWTAGYPKVSGIGTNYASMVFSINDAGSGYYVIIPYSGSAPSAAQVKAGTDSGDTALSAGLYGSTALTANVETILSASNLKYSTYYTAYFVAEDDAENATATAVASYNFRAAVPAPGVPGYYSIKNIQKRRRKKEAFLRGMIYS